MDKFSAGMLDAFNAMLEQNTKMRDLVKSIEALQKKTDSLDKIAEAVRSMAKSAELTNKVADLQGTLKDAMNSYNASIDKLNAAVKKLEEAQNKCALKDDVIVTLNAIKEECMKDAEEKAAASERRIQELDAAIDEGMKATQEMHDESKKAIDVLREKMNETFILFDEKMTEIQEESDTIGVAVAELAMVTVPKPDDEPSEIYTEEHSIFVRVNANGEVVEIANDETVNNTAVFVGGNPWIEVDRGRGAKFDDPEANGYLDGGLQNENGVLLYCVKDGKLCKRSGAAVRIDSKKSEGR